MASCMLRLVSLAMVCVIIMIVAATGLSSRSGPAAKTTSVAETKPSASANGDDTELARDASGKFRIGAIVNGEDMQFLLDTGADTIALGVDEAERLGIELDRESFEPIAQTASGTGNGAHIKINSIEIAGQEFRDVDAVHRHCVAQGLDVTMSPRDEAWGKIVILSDAIST